MRMFKKALLVVAVMLPHMVLLTKLMAGLESAREVLLKIMNPLQKSLGQVG